MSSPAALTRQVKAEARRRGFDLVGVTTAGAPPHLGVYRQWLAAGFHGEMDYLATERALRRRSNPGEILPECRSILVLGANYLAQADRSQGGARIAAYALGEDYHEVLVERLEGLVAFIDGWLGEAVPNRIYTDTGPILERELGQRAGLGWIGKNTCLINPQKGSYFFLAEVLLGVELIPDKAFEADRCGTCTRCIEACPTGCIRDDRTLDATRCISYLTIELKGGIPKGQRADTGGWLFGCDVCQQVCPWNQRFARPTPDPAFQAREELNPPELEPLLVMGEGYLKRIFRRSPLRRAKLRGLTRNALLVAGNLRRRDLAPQIAQILAQALEPMLRAHAAWALGEIRGEFARSELERAAQSGDLSEVKQEIEAALTKCQAR
jgi:epoxyqueuosine reductase